MAIAGDAGPGAVMTTGRDIRLLLTDVDGTLVTHDKILTSEACAAAADLRRSGVEIALTSARPPAGMRMLIDPLGLDLPLGGFNGGLITGADLQPLERHPITPDAVKTAVGSLTDSGLDVWVYTERDWFVTRLDSPHVAREAWIIKQDPQPAPASLDGPGPVFKIVGVSDEQPRMAQAEAVTHRLLEGVASVSRSAPHYLDITDKQATKGHVVRSLARRLSLAQSQIATIGDMPNDILMFRESGFSIAMGNADAVVKAAADVVTDSNESEGFAKAVRRFLLGAVETDNRRA